MASLSNTFGLKQQNPSCKLLFHLPRHKAKRRHSHNAQGNKMAQRLRSLGFPVTVWNRTAAKSQPLEALGCAVAPSAAAAVAAADVTLLMLADADAIEAVLLKDASTMSALGGKTIVQMGTIGPKQAQAIAAAVEAAGAAFLEAPVLGSQPEATAGTLLIMVGCAGDMTASPAFPVLLAFGSKISYMGAVGTAAASKLALNQLIGALTVGFSTSLAMVQKNDVDLDKWMGILRESALYAPTYDKKLDKYLSRSYGVANFPLVHLRKDVRLFAEEATKAACDTTFLRSMEGLCEEAVARGFGYADYSAVYEAVVEPVRAGESITPEA